MASKTIILTGASRGIGQAIAQFLLQDPAIHNLVLLGGRTKDAFTRVTSEWPKQVKVVPGDLSDFSLAQQAIDLAVSSFGKVDALIVNHGTLGEFNRIAECDVNEVRRTFDVNFFSTIACVQAAIPELRKSRGRIILTSSGAAVNAYASWGSYGASKAAMNHLALTLKNEEPHINTIAIRPGVVDTAMQEALRGPYRGKMDPKDSERFMNLKRSHSLLRPEQPGNVIAKLSLDAPAELSGQFLSWNDERLGDLQD